jgi:hypothetical protein
MLIEIKLFSVSWITLQIQERGTFGITYFQVNIPELNLEGKFIKAVAKEEH